MDATQRAPQFDDRFPELNHFICSLAEQFNEGQITSWDDLEVQVHAFFTPVRMTEMELAVPGWSKMASYTDGITLIHVMCVFLGMYMLPEFQNLNWEQQNLMKWVILFHDAAKIHIRGQKATMHAFHSGVVTANALANLDFPVTDQYLSLLPIWNGYTKQAFLSRIDDPSPIPDNRKLPEILAGIEQMYGRTSPGTLVIKTVILHISLHVDDMYPTPAPLTQDEAIRYIDADLFPLLRVMMLSDNEGWSLFDPETRARQRRDTLAAFDKLK